MRFQYDHDLHIHSQLSLCSNDPAQSNERILKYAEDNKLCTICLTDHFWDSSVEGASNWYGRQDYAHISQAKPLPQSGKVRFLFGCETELNRFLTLGIAKEHLELFDFVIIPTTHFHMKGYTLFEEEIATPAARAKAWSKRLEYILDQDLPFKKIGLAHLTCELLAPTAEEYLEMLGLIPDEEMRRLFKKAAEKGVGIELNADDFRFKFGGVDSVLRPYLIAKECGCKFYCGSDAHHPHELEEAKAIFERAIDLLGLEESDKFLI
jgi:histidinol phosphatase-like PHP family hydrolase